MTLRMDGREMAGMEREGQEPFWRAAYDRHGGALLAYLSRRTPRQEAEDLVQETFLRAIRSGSLIGESEGRLRAYLFTIAKHLLIDAARRPRLLQLLADDGEGGEAAIVEPATETPAPEAAIDAARTLDRVGACLDRLSEAHRSAFRLAVLERRSYREVASALGCSLDQVRTNVHRARRKVIAMLAESSGEVS
jgi:RNA polymerase sigma-70 factor (ECF subfamily)